jgi:hypothetical protein
MDLVRKDSDRDGPVNEGPPVAASWSRRAILLSCAIVLGAYHIFASAVMYPVPGGDAFVFMPAAINLEAGRGLTNSLWEVAPDPTGQHRYLGHPPLFQMMVSACMRKAETRSAFIVLATFNALTLALYAAFLCTAKCARKLIASTAGFVVLLSSMLALAFLIFNDASGRPEVLSTLILALAIGVVTWLPRKCWPICLGIAIGITGAIHPVHGIFIGCLVTIVFLLTARVPQVVGKLILAAAVALTLFWMLLRLSPYPVGETLHAVSEHAALANGNYPLSALFDFYLKLAPWSGLHLLGLCLLLVWCGIHSWRSAENRVTRAARLAALLLTAFAFWFFSIRRPTSSYYLMMLTPALIAGAVYLFDVRSRLHDRPSTAHPLWILAALFGIFSLFLARDVALFVNYRTDGVSFADAQKDFGDLMRSSGQVISVSESLWVLTDEFERITIVERGTASGDLMVVQQTQRGSLSPPTIPGYRLLSHHFVSHPPHCFGFPIGRTMPGYSFAVFAREVAVGENCQPTRVNHGS